MNLDTTNLNKTPPEPVCALGTGEQANQTSDGLSNSWRLPLQSGPSPAGNRHRDLCPDAKATQAYEFEGLLVDILARFVNLPPQEVDREMECALRRVGDFLGVEGVGLWHHSADSGSFVLTHHSQSAWSFPTGSAPEPAPNTSRVQPGVKSTAFCPWIAAQARRGRTTLFSRIEDLPKEAAPDKEALSRSGIRSAVFIPFLIGGEVLGAANFEMLSEERAWSDALLRRLEFAAKVFAHATSRTLADQELRVREAQLTLAAGAANAALWSLDLQTKRFETTSKAYELLRLNPASELTFDGFLNMVHPEDRERVRTGTDEAIRTRAEIDIEFRVVLPGDKIYWVSSRGRCQYSSNGTPERLMGATVNITERKRAESFLRESENRFRIVADSAPVLIWMSGTDKLCMFFNKPWLEFTGRTLEQELGNGWTEAVHPDDLHRCLETYLKAFEAREAFVMEYRLRRHDGIYRWITDNGVPRYEPQGNFAGYIGSCVDITERKLAEEALAKSCAEIKQLKDKLQAEADYLKSEIKISHPHGHVIGRSQSLKRVLHKVEQVAPVECSVLITGETGTGKELIAQEIHSLSGRRGRIMVLVNCAALPSPLVESELFGRERGAYTGAMTSQVGRFEVANGSTIFLDEVGELSMEVQAKLLRVLQQGEFQRLGSPKTHKVDARVIAATNRDLAEEVRKGRFREDLYYRLRVFPIELPPLRDHTEDIPLLAFAFMEELSARMGKKITKIPRKSMELLLAHSWPGNVRELRNVIEHSVILTIGDTLKLSTLGESSIKEAQPVTLADAERDHIVRTLESTGWRIKGPHGAAARLDLQPSTLYSRMQKLGIPHRRKKDEMLFNR